MRFHGSVCVLASGGMDSSILIHDLARQYKKVFPVFIQGGLFWEKAELYWLAQFLSAIKTKTLEPLKILDLPAKDIYGAHWSTTGKKVPDHQSPDHSVYLPGRNLMLLTKAAVFCSQKRISRIAISSLKGNPFPDAGRPFFSSMEKALGRGLAASLSIITPYLTLSKEELIQRKKNLPFELTFSCISPVGYNHCGNCNKCAERQNAFAKAKIIDKTLYLRKSVTNTLQIKHK